MGRWTGSTGRGGPTLTGFDRRDGRHRLVRQAARPHHQAVEQPIEGDTLRLIEHGEQGGLALAPRRFNPGDKGAARFRDAEGHAPAILGVGVAVQPAPRLEAADRTADRHLVHPEKLAECACGDRAMRRGEGTEHAPFRQRQFVQAFVQPGERARDQVHQKNELEEGGAARPGRSGLVGRWGCWGVVGVWRHGGIVVRTLGRCQRRRHDSRRLPDVTSAIVLLDSLSSLRPDHAGAVVVTGSHGGVSAMLHAMRFRPRAVICHDGGIGRDGAGVAGLQAIGIPAAAVDGRTARIGDAQDLLHRGALSCVNPAAMELGLRPAMSAAAAVSLLGGAGPVRAMEAPGPPRTPRLAQPGCIIADSISLLSPAHRGLVAVVGSHAAPAAVAVGLPFGLLGCIHHDAGAAEDGGCDAHGIAGLALWAGKGVPAAAAAGSTARIGDGEDVLARGVLSAVNDAAAALGLRPGMTVRDAVTRMNMGRAMAGLQPVKTGAGDE